MSISSQLRKKIRLERTLKPEIRSIFATILRDFKVSIASTGRPQDARHYRASFSGVLDNHYDRVQRAFTGESIDKDTKFFIFRKQSEEELEDDRLDLFLLALLTWRSGKSDRQSDFIISTTSNDMFDSVEKARRALFEDGIMTPTNRELSEVSASILKRKQIGRIETIAMSETQSAAESTKFIEAEARSDLRPRVLGGIGITATKKKWVTVGDSKVRDKHISANGQTRNLLEPFEVGGDRLNHPGDSSLGASADNVINCRCMSFYQF